MNQRRDVRAYNRFRGTDAVDAALEHRRQRLRDEHHADEGNEQQARTAQSDLLRGRRGMGFIGAATGRQKIIAVTNGLHEQKRTVENEGHYRGENQLRWAEGWTKGRDRDIRKNERERGQNDEYG